MGPSFRLNVCVRYSNVLSCRRIEEDVLMVELVSRFFLPISEEKDLEATKRKDELRTEHSNGNTKIVRMSMEYHVNNRIGYLHHRITD